MSWFLSDNGNPHLSINTILTILDFRKTSETIRREIKKFKMNDGISDTKRTFNVLIFSRNEYYTDLSLLGENNKDTAKHRCLITIRVCG